jgi:hypothetical protein
MPGTPDDAFWYWRYIFYPQKQVWITMWNLCLILFYLVVIIFLVSLSSVSNFNVYLYVYMVSYLINCWKSLFIFISGTQLLFRHSHIISLCSTQFNVYFRYVNKQDKDLQFKE